MQSRLLAAAAVAFSLLVWSKNLAEPENAAISAPDDSHRSSISASLTTTRFRFPLPGYLESPRDLLAGRGLKGFHRVEQRGAMPDQDHGGQGTVVENFEESLGEHFSDGFVKGGYLA